MNNIEFKKILQTIWCKIKDLTNIHNNLEGLQGGQEGQYYHLTKDQYDCVVDNCNENCTIGKWTIPEFFNITYVNESGNIAIFKIKDIQEVVNPGESRLIKVDIGGMEEIIINMLESSFTDFTYTNDDINGLTGILQYDNLKQAYTMIVDTSKLLGNGINIHTM